MNGLYGYSLAGPAALGALGENEDESKIALLWDIATGKAKIRLEGSKREAERMDKKMNRLREKLNAMHGSEKENFFVVYREANQKVIDFKKKLNKAVQSHNKLSEMVSKATLGQWNPERIGLAQPVIFLVAVTAVLVGGAIFISALSSWFNGERGLLATANNAIDKADSIAKTITPAITSVGDSAIKVAFAGAIALVSYIVFKNFKGRKKRRVSVDVPAMKPVLGRVAA